MFYKKDENDWWMESDELIFPDGTILNESNKTPYDGWVWMDDKPYSEPTLEEYLSVQIELAILEKINEMEVLQQYEV